MSLKVPKITKKTVPIEEELFHLIFSEAEPEIDRMVDMMSKYLETGRGKLAEKYMKGVNIYYYLLTYSMNIYNFLDRDSSSDKCNLVNNKYQFHCVEDNLKCLSSQYNTDYVGFWVRIKEILGLNITKECVNSEDAVEDCCVGIGEMIIQDTNCKVFEIGSCEPASESFEFADCEFKLDEFDVEDVNC